MCSNITILFLRLWKHFSFIFYRHTLLSRLFFPNFSYGQEEGCKEEDDKEEVVEEEAPIVEFVLTEKPSDILAVFSFILSSSECCFS